MCFTEDDRKISIGGEMKMKEKKSKKAKMVLFWVMSLIAVVYFVLKEKEYI
jgi:predicted nucleic acid-binding Zn ribbon protein